MALLVYAVTEPEGNPPSAQTGVQGADVRIAVVSNLRCFYSLAANFSGNPARDAALEFHRVVQALFDVVDLIPFRFPTLFADEAALLSGIQEQAAQYHEWLARIRGQVQMEIRISFRNSDSSPVEKLPDRVSGAEYLRTRQARQRVLQEAAEIMKSASGELTRDWRVLVAPDQVRCFGLLFRDSLPGFQQGLRTAVIASDLIARVSGPWPPTEFLKEIRP